jgi:hypothetical protein
MRFKTFFYNLFYSQIYSHKLVSTKCRGFEAFRLQDISVVI